MYQALILLSLLGFTSAADKTLIPKTSLNSQTDFDASFNYLYPWGSDHNGAARMDKAHVSLANSVVTLTAQPVTGQKDATHGGKQIPIHYLSGAIHAKQHFTVTTGSTLTFTGDFKATTMKGTWPAFWLTAVNGWPPEVDMAEWKGSGKISFNTFNTSSSVQAKDVTYSNPGDWHSIKCELRDVNGKDVGVKFWMDGQQVVSQTGKGYVGSALYLIINLQMEGSSGSPGPTTNTTYSARNLEVISSTP
ncbi:concanavalin A-like lectin/glucanase domain-containing protein [Tricladium varicosporioides]|nr:concanavalin A-like lectin/glucanase domain-containing protein [Hymenoscyphus varicosporioides]